MEWSGGDELSAPDVPRIPCAHPRPRPPRRILAGGEGRASIAGHRRGAVVHGARKGRPGVPVRGSAPGSSSSSAGGSQASTGGSGNSAPDVPGQHGFGGTFCLFFPFPIHFLFFLTRAGIVMVAEAAGSHASGSRTAVRSPSFGGSGSVSTASSGACPRYVVQERDRTPAGPQPWAGLSGARVVHGRR